MELLSTKIVLSTKMSCLIKTGYQPKVHAIFMLSKQQLNTSHSQYTLHDHLVGNPVFTKKEFSS